MRNICFIIFFILYSNVISGQSLRSPVTARYIALGAYSIQHADVFSFTSNQAALMQVKTSGIGVYGERRFLLFATNMYTVVVAIPTKQGNFGLQADYFGFKNYNESQVGLAYARNLGKIDVGVKFNYYSFRIPSYGTSSTVNFELGAVAHLSDKLHAGIHVYNPVAANLSNTDNEKLTSIYKFGMGYEPSEKFFVSGEIVKEEDKDIGVNIGFQYNFMDQFFIRAGTSTETTNSYVGAGVSWKNVRIDVTGGYHPQLGFTPGLMLIVNFNKKQD